MTEENQNLEETTGASCSKGKCFCGKLFCLKGLATIYKVLSILVLILMLVVLVWAWVDVFKLDASIVDGLLVSLTIIVQYGLAALVLITVSRVLKTLRKIKHAVEHK